MSANKNLNEKLSQLNKKLDIIVVALLAKSGLTRKEIAKALGVSEKTIERLIPVSKIKGTKTKKEELERELIAIGTDENEQKTTD
jgi:transposase